MRSAPTGLCWACGGRSRGRRRGETRDFGNDREPTARLAPRTATVAMRIGAVVGRSDLIRIAQRIGGLAVARPGEDRPPRPAGPLEGSGVARPDLCRGRSRAASRGVGLGGRAIHGHRRATRLGTGFAPWSDWSRRDLQGRSERFWRESTPRAPGRGAGRTGSGAVARPVRRRAPDANRREPDHGPTHGQARSTPPGHPAQFGLTITTRMTTRDPA